MLIEHPVSKWEVKEFMQVFGGELTGTDMHCTNGLELSNLSAAAEEGYFSEDGSLRQMTILAKSGKFELWKIKKKS